MFKPEQLPFIGYAAKIREMKRQFDRDRGAYPLFVDVYDASGEVIMRETLDYVHVRAGRGVMITSIYEWEAPVKIRFLGFDGREFSETLQKVHVDAGNLPIFTDDDVVGTFLEQKKKLEPQAASVGAA